MIKKIFIGVLGFVIFVVVAISIFYLLDKNYRLAELESDSELAETSVGVIEYKITGDKGPVILSFHGTPGGYDDDVSIEGCRILTFSRPGYLRTPLHVGKTPAEQAQASSALLDSLGIERVVVAGGSGGGPSAICFAALFPEKTAALIALEAVSQPLTASNKSVPSFLKSDFFSWFFLTLLRNDSFFRLQLNTLMTNQTNRKLILEDPKKFELLRNNIWQAMWPPSKRTEGLQNDIIQFGSLNLPISEVRVPTLIVHGAEDTDVPISQSKTLSEAIPNSRFEIIKGADHFMLLSHHEKIQNICIEFLKDINIIKK